MLAVVQPYSASPDVPHRPSRSTVSASSRSTSSNLAHNHPPSLQRHQTAPPAAPTQRRAPTPPPKPPSPPPPASSSSETPPFDIHSYPATDLLKLLALLLTHIATTNDHLSPTSTGSSSAHGQPTSPIDPEDAPPIWKTLTTASRNAVSTPAATLTFHARNIPTISLEAYLLRILKYCPTTNHVFLSLLVYFDRMSKLSEDAIGRAFVIDSYNIHRLVIAGVTVASKFFSDVFYTNSRYAKVGGLPLPELNQLELQFLLLNDFRLVISGAEMQHYAEQLILFSKSTSTSHLQLSPAPNGHSSSHSHTTNHHPHPHHHHTRPQPQPHPPASTSSSASSPPTPPPSNSNSNSNSHSSSSDSSTLTVTGRAATSTPQLSVLRSSPNGTSHSSPARPLDALGGIPMPVHNHNTAKTGNTNHYPHTQPQPLGYDHQQATPQLVSFTQPHSNSTSLSHPRQHSHSHLQSHPHPPPHPNSHSQTLPRVQSQRHSLSQFQQQQQQQQAYLNGVHQEMADSEQDLDDDASTDAGTDLDSGTDGGTDATETSTDDEPTIRAPGTVVGGGSVSGSVWGDAREEEDDERMRSP